MDRRLAVALWAVAGVGLTLSCTSERARSTWDAAVTEVLPNLQIPAEKLSRLEVTRPGAPPIALERSGPDWTIVSPIVYGVDQDAVDSMIAVLDEIEIVRRVASRPASHHLLAPTSAIAVRAWVGDAVTQEILVGGQAARETFVQLAGDDRVFAALGRIRPIFDKPLSRLRDPIITDVPIADIERVSYVNDSGKIDPVSAADGSGRFAEQRPALRNFHGDRARANVAVLAGLRAKEFADGDLDKAATGLFDGAATATLWIRGRAEPLQVWIGSQKGRLLYVRTSESDQIYLVSSHLASSLIVRKDHLERTETQLAQQQESPAPDDSPARAETSHGHQHGSEGPPQQIPAEVMTELRELAAQQRMTDGR